MDTINRAVTTDTNHHTVTRVILQILLVKQVIHATILILQPDVAIGGVLKEVFVLGPSRAEQPVLTRRVVTAEYLEPQRPTHNLGLDTSTGQPLLVDVGVPETVALVIVKRVAILGLEQCAVCVRHLSQSSLGSSVVIYFLTC